MKKINYILLLLIFVFKLSAQDDLIISHSRFMQKTNPSFMGINNMNKIIINGIASEISLPKFIV